MHTTRESQTASASPEPRPDGEPARIEVLRALHEIAVTTGGVLAAPELAYLVVQRALELLGANGAGLYVSDGTGAFLLPLYSSDAREEAPEPAVTVGVGAAGQAFESGEPIRVSDYAAWTNAGPWARAQGVRAALAVPLKVADRCIGSLSVRSYVAREWTSTDLQTLTLLAAQVAPVLEAARLHEQSERRARDLQGLYDAEAILHRSLRVEGVLQALVDIATDLLQSDKTSVLVWDERHEMLVVGASRGFSPRTLAHMQHGPGEGISWLVATQGQPISVRDAAADPRVVHKVTEPEGIRSLLHVPIMRDNQVAGVFAVNYCQPRVFTGDEQRLLTALAQRAALALDNAELFERERLSREQLELALEAGRMGTWSWNSGTNRITGSPQLEAIHGSPGARFGPTLDEYLPYVHPEDRERFRLAAAASLDSGELQLEYRIVWPDGSTHWLEARGRTQQRGHGQPVRLLGVCLDVTDRKLAEQERGRLIERERIALRANAALEERQKLARDLHDSVSQALYGIALGTQTALDALTTDHDAGAAAEAIQYVLDLSEAGLTEMRSLIFELRPESLQTEGLVAAIERNVAAVRSRHGLQVDTDLIAEPDLPLASREALYRIAQEALSNCVKHAHARSVRLRLGREADGVTLEVADDGLGFDADRAYPGHLGLISMRERTVDAGGQFSITSTPGHGTRVVVHLPVEQLQAT